MYSPNFQQATILPLKDRIHTAVIKPTSGKAYIQSAEGIIKWDVAGIIHTLYNNSRNAYIHFLDVYYIQDELYFFINTGEAYDFRFSFDPVTGEVGELILSY